jgi:hypothetical protein
MIVSDVRYPGEAESILRQPNGIVLCFDAKKETLDSRLLKRDGRLMSGEHSSHSSENQIEEIKNIATSVISTDEMSLEEQTAATINIVKEIVEVINAKNN